MRRRPKRLVRCGWHLVCLAHHGWHSGAHQPEGRRTAGQSGPRLLSTRSRRVRFWRQQFLQFEQWQCREQRLRFLRRHFGRYGRRLHGAQLFPRRWHGRRSLNFQFIVRPRLWHQRRLGLRHGHRERQRCQPGQQLGRRDTAARLHPFSIACKLDHAPGRRRFDHHYHQPFEWFQQQRELERVRPSRRCHRRLRHESRHGQQFFDAIFNRYCASRHVFRNHHGNIRQSQQ